MDLFIEKTIKRNLF